MDDNVKQCFALLRFTPDSYGWSHCRIKQYNDGTVDIIGKSWKRRFRLSYDGQMVLTDDKCNRSSAFEVDYWSKPPIGELRYKRVQLEQLESLLDCERLHVRHLEEDIAQLRKEIEELASN